MPVFDTFVLVEQRIEGSTEGQKCDKAVKNDRARTAIPGPSDEQSLNLKPNVSAKGLAHATPFAEAQKTTSLQFR